MTGTDTPTAGRRAWLGLAVLALPCLLLAMDLSVLYVAASSISADLEPSSALLSSVEVTTFTAAVLAGVAAVLVAVLLRRAGQETAAEPEPAERGADAHGDAALRYGSEPARA